MAYDRRFDESPDGMSESTALRNEPALREAMPPDIGNVYIYEAFNTASWSVVLGAPMLLFFQQLKATATVVAISACLAPVLNILQLPAAYYVERVGYRRFVLSGWTLRSCIVAGMTLVALLPARVDPATCMVLMLGLALIYNTLRGISSAGFLPWFTHIVPEGRRGEFLAKDQFAGALAAITCLFVSGALLQHTAWYSFGVVFAISAACAFASLLYLRRIPDVPVEKIVPNPNPLPWSEMLFYPPFFRYVCYNMVINMALGASGVFWVRFFRVSLQVSNAVVLYVAAGTTLVVAASLIMIGPLLDRTGNKPALTLSGLILVGHFLTWSLVAAGILPANLTMIIIQCFTSGLASALWNLANVRIIMGIVPHMGRPHFLALYTVAGNLSVGLMPLAWGPVMDLLAHWHHRWGPWEWNAFSVFYVALAGTIGVGLLLLRRVMEPVTMTWDEFMTELLVKTPSRALSRLIVRLRGPGIG
jgi:MFS family permease